MERKYWVPALERANNVLKFIATRPSKLKMVDLTNEMEVSKSTLFSLLRTMEELQWIVHEKDGTYSLGSFFANLESVYFKQFDLIEWFQKEAKQSVEHIGESVQLAKLEKEDILYLAKKEASTPVKLVTEPGMKFPAHTTAMGKMLLSYLSLEELNALFPNEKLNGSTQNTVKTKKELITQLQEIKKQGISFDLEESVIGFCCVAAPVFNHRGKVIAAVSVSMPTHQWECKKEKAKKEICKLANLLSAVKDTTLSTGRDD